MAFRDTGNRLQMHCNQPLYFTDGERRRFDERNCLTGRYLGGDCRFEQGDDMGQRLALAIPATFEAGEVSNTSDDRAVGSAARGGRCS